MNPPSSSNPESIRPYILVVDDEEEFRTALKALLEGDGYAVLTACDGEDAFRLTKKYDIRLIISDLRMPILNGIALLELIRDQNPQIKVIIVTAYEEVASYIKVMSLGAFEYLKKPLDMNKLKELVAGVMSDEE
ncbi:MAG: response regulator [bacterium]|nr:response regulator [bacterium]